MTDTAVQTKTPIQVRKFGHLVYEVSDIDRSVAFWTEILGFRVSDTNEIGMVFLRSSTTTEHHGIALIPTDKTARPPSETGLQYNHLAMEVDDMDALLRAREFFRARGIPIEFNGRKGPGGGAGIEFYDPDGYMFELYTGMDHVPENGRSRPPEQFDRVKSLEEAAARPLPTSW